MKAQIVEQIELFSEAELKSLEFLAEELEAIEEERVPDLDSISFEDIVEDLEATLEQDWEVVLEGRRPRLRRKPGMNPLRPPLSLPSLSSSSLSLPIQRPSPRPLSPSLVQRVLQWLQQVPSPQLFPPPLRPRRTQSLPPLRPRSSSPTLGRPQKR